MVICVPLFCAICKEGNTSIPRNHFRQITWQFFLQHHFYHGLASTSCSNLSAHAWFLAHLVISSFCLISNVLSFTLCTKLGLPHPLTFKLIQCICGQPLNLVGTHLFYCSHGGIDCIPWCCSRCLHLHHEKCGVSCITWTNSCPCTTFLLIFLPVGWHYVINWWHPHHHECCHYSSHLSKIWFHE